MAATCAYVWAYRLKLDIARRWLSAVRHGGSSEWLNLIGNLFAGRDVIAMIGT